MEPLRDGRTPVDNYNKKRSNTARTLEVSGGGKNAVWTKAHHNRMQLKVNNVSLEGEGHHVLYVEAWDSDDTGNELIGWGMVHLANVLRGAGAGVDVHVMVDLFTYDKKGKANAQGQLSLSVKFEPYVGLKPPPPIRAGLSWLPDEAGYLTLLWCIAQLGGCNSFR